MRLFKRGVSFSNREMRAMAARLQKEHELQRDAAVFRAQIMQPGRKEYWVPRGYLQEPFRTSLHVALRQLRDEGKIRYGGTAPHGEIWVPA